MNTDWARILRIKEAYGFIETEFMRWSWRSALGYSAAYRFEDTNGVFPITEMPDERRSMYHDSHYLFVDEYIQKHGLELVYDHELARKRYPTKPLRYS
nr:MAG TPA: hypothetical protein [Caudoviricetes sp.]